MFYALVIIGLCYAQAPAPAEVTPVPIFFTKTYPVTDPVATYDYFDIVPFCKSESTTSPWLVSITRVLEGDRMVKAPFEIHHGEPKASTPIQCSTEVLQRDPMILLSLRKAIENAYMFEIEIAGLTIVRPIGIMIGGKAFLLTKFDFSLEYDRTGVITSASLAAISSSSFTDIGPVDSKDIYGPQPTLNFSYSVQWRQNLVSEPRDLAQTKADQELKQFTLLNQEIAVITDNKITSIIQRTTTLTASTQWISLLNSVLILSGVFIVLLLVLIRAVKSDLARLFCGAQNHPLFDANWKLLHADVFRAPPHRMLLCACIGAGTQLLQAAALATVLGALGYLKEHGKFTTAFMFLYPITAFSSGFESSKWYRRLGGTRWAWSTVMTSLVFAGPAFIVWAILNTLALLYSSNAAFPFLTILIGFVLYLGVTLPLTILGGMTGRHYANIRGKSMIGAVGEKIVLKVERVVHKRYQQELKPINANDETDDSSNIGSSQDLESQTKQPEPQRKEEGFFPCRTNRLPREIPKSKSNYIRSFIAYLVCGLVSFSAIYLQVKAVMNSTWNVGAPSYGTYGLLGLSSALVLSLSCLMTCLFAYTQLNGENHRWWWNAFLVGGSVAGFFVIYCAGFFLKSKMHEPLQIAFFGLYSLLAAYALHLMVASVAITTTLRFLVLIYSSVKAE